MIVFLIIVAMAGQTLCNPMSRIIGGEPADIDEYPYQCSLRYSGSHTCGCAIFSPSKILTAAHCVDGRSLSLFSVYAGSNNLTGDGVLKNIQTVFQHENYNDDSGTFANDIAVIILSSEFDFISNPKIQPGDLARDNSHDFAGEICILTGWGRTSSSNLMSEMLMKVTVQVLSIAECRSAMSNINGINIQYMHICAQTINKDGGSCNGDSGGPMNCGGKIAGVSSWVIDGQCTGEFPSVYTRVSNFYDWIASK